MSNEDKDIAPYLFARILRLELDCPFCGFHSHYTLQPIRAWLWECKQCNRKLVIGLRAMYYPQGYRHWEITPTDVYKLDWQGDSYKPNSSVNVIVKVEDIKIGP